MLLNWRITYKHVSKTGAFTIIETIGVKSDSSLLTVWRVIGLYYRGAYITIILYNIHDPVAGYFVTYATSQFKGKTLIKWSRRNLSARLINAVLRKLMYNANIKIINPHTDYLNVLLCAWNRYFNYLLYFNINRGLQIN